jgi:hypothetical protein
MRFRKPTHGKLRLTGTAIDVVVILLAVWMAYTATQRSTVVINCRKQRLRSKPHLSRCILCFNGVNLAVVCWIKP